MPAPEPREWDIRDANDDGQVGFVIYDDSESANMLNDDNIWQIVDALISMNLVTSNATVRSKRGEWSESIQRPVEEV